MKNQQFYYRDAEQSASIKKFETTVLELAQPLNGHSQRYLKAVGHMAAIDQMLLICKSNGMAILKPDKWIRICIDGKWRQIDPHHINSIFRKIAKICGLQVDKKTALLMSGYLGQISHGLGLTQRNFDKLCRRCNS